MKIFAAAGAALVVAMGVCSARPEGRAGNSLADAPLRLAGTGLYAAGQPTAVDPANRAFTPQYPLWSDGLMKRRWVYLPAGAAIDGADEHDWTFPVGTKFWKEFSREGRKVETRFLWRASDTSWIAATYVWNEDGTDAVLAPEEGVPGAVEVAPGKRHSIPSRTDCTACHGAPPRGPLGFNALQLSTARDPNAIHGEPLAPGMLTIETLVSERRLLHSRADFVSNPPRIRTADPGTRAVLGYLSANCAMCHDGRGEIAVAGPVVTARDLVTDGDAVASRLAAQTTFWQIPGQPDGSTMLVKPGAPDLSALFVRMRSRSPSSQMPPLGSVLRDQAAAEAVRLWISHLGAR